MSIRTREEILNSIRDRIGDDANDENLALIEDITDTFTDLESKASNNINWEQKYNENDAEWRKKYRDRFFSQVDDPEPPIDATKSYNFEDLFK